MILIKQVGSLILLIAISFMLVAALGSCSVGVPRGLTVVDDFEVDRYLGTWYEIARLDHRFERDLDQVTATYSKRDDGGITVINRGYDTIRQIWKESEGKAYFVDSPDQGQLKVSFFGPFYGGYNIIELDREQYRYAMIAGPDRDYLWILARQPELDQGVLSGLLDKAGQAGFEVSKLIMVNHQASDTEARLVQSPASPAR